MEKEEPMTYHVLAVIFWTIVAAMTFFFVGVIIVGAWPLFLIMFLVLTTKGFLDERRL